MWSLITVTTALAPLPHQPHYAILGLANNHRKVCLLRTEFKSIFELKNVEVVASTISENTTSCMALSTYFINWAAFQLVPWC